jgi:Na+/melibiose symporter-like transporter
MRKKISSLRLSIFSRGLILFAFFFLIQQFWEMVVSGFALLPSLAFIQILLMILSTFLISKLVKKRSWRQVLFGSYLLIIGSLFSFWLANNPMELQAVTLYMIGAFFGGILWEYLAQRLATDLLAKEHKPR